MGKRSTRLAGLVLAGISSLGICESASAVVSTFSSDAEGWGITSFSDLSSSSYSVAGTYSPDYHGTAGNPGGYISEDDPDSGDFMFSAPAAFLGDKSIALNTTLTYDLVYFSTANYQTTDVMLVNGTTRLVWIRNPAIVPTSSFATISVPINPTSEWHVGGPAGALATNTDFTTVLSNLTGLFIRGEYAFGADTTGIDNVTLIPEPASSLFAAMGIVGGAFVRRRRV